MAQSFILNYKPPQWSARINLDFKIGFNDELLQRWQNIVAQILTIADIPLLMLFSSFSSSSSQDMATVNPQLLSREG